MREGRSVSGAEERRWPRSIATVAGGRGGNIVYVYIDFVALHLSVFIG
jgi:hypothetical protein